MRTLLRVMAELLHAALPRLDALVIEDPEQLLASLRLRHPRPSSSCFRPRLKGHRDNGRQHVLALHCPKQALRHLLGALHSRGITLNIRHPLADLAPPGLAQGVIVVAQPTLVV